MLTTFDLWRLLAYYADYEILPKCTLYHCIPDFSCKKCPQQLKLKCNIYIISADLIMKGMY